MFIRKIFPLALLTFFVLIVFLPLGISIYQYTTTNVWPTWSGFGEHITSTGSIREAKTFWDILELIIIPFSLAIIAYLFGLSERQAKENIEAERYLNDQEIQANIYQNEVLHKYFADMSKFLLEYKLQDLDNDSIIRDIARARTLTTFRELDSARKGTIFRFLYESQLILVGTEVVNLRDADMRGINLLGSNCYGANISGVNASRGVFFRADLRYASLKKGYFEKANFRSADLRAANLSGSNLSNADFSNCLIAGADFSYSNLYGAIVDKEQLALAQSLKGSIMPNGEPFESK